MITQETAENIWKCYREIEVAKKLVEEINNQLEKKPDLTEPTLKDAFGRQQSLQLGVPSGSNSQRLFNVPVDLAVKIIERHIQEQEKNLEELKQSSIVELSGNDR